MKPQNKHTPEPWRCNEWIVESSSCRVAGCCETYVDGQSESNAARIIECVNALAGLNPAAIGAVVEALERCISELDQCSRDDKPSSPESTRAAAITALAALKGQS